MYIYNKEYDILFMPSPSIAAEYHILEYPVLYGILVNPARWGQKKFTRSKNFFRHCTMHPPPLARPGGRGLFLSL